MPECPTRVYGLHAAGLPLIQAMVLLAKGRSLRFDQFYDVLIRISPSPVAVPLGLEHPIHAAGKRPSEERFIRVHHLAERFQIDSGLDPDLLEEVDAILGGDVAGSTLHKRTAPEASRGDIE
jgi:hypothetical protein